MIRKPRTRAGRPAFTLIELLVVIAIIAVLVSLTATAVMAVLRKGPEVQTRVEISQMESDIAGVRRDLNNVPFIPSRIKLSETNYYPQASVMGTDDYYTVQFLKQAFGKHTCYDFQYPLPAGVFIDWNGNGQPDLYPNATTGSPDDGIVLEGQQCLVFFLGGIPTAAGVNGTLGFSKDSQNPTLPPSPGSSRWGPYFEFKSPRLKAGPGGFFSYMDAYGTGQPYAYFASYNPEGVGQYNRPVVGATVTNDCPSLFPNPPYTGQPGFVVPYQQPNTIWVNPTGVQIISAGRDGKFGTPSLWSPKGGTTDPNGRDDQSNFVINLMAAGQN
jgi:prepilin-type N-terminal cleavage/methylation domain-containing protein